MTRGQSNERMRRGDATTSWRDELTRGRHNEMMTRGYATTSWHDEVKRGRHNERQHNLVVFQVQIESSNKVAAMVIARIERKPERLSAGDESQHLSDVVQNGLKTLRHHKDMRAKMAHPFIRVSGAKRPRVLER
jgi:hypothetical protein